MLQEKQFIFKQKDLNKWDLDELNDIDISKLINDFKKMEPFMLKSKTLELNNLSFALNTQNTSFLWDIFNTLSQINY